MQPQRALEGTVVENPNGEASEMKRLRETLSHLTRELNDALRENEELRKRVASADKPIARLREKLGPFYQLLRAIFGDIEEIAPDDAPAPSGVSPQRSGAWDSWKSKLGGKQAEFIELLLVHGEMSAKQLKAAAHCAEDTVYKTVYKLNRAGLLNKNGGRFSLKQL